MEVLALLCVGNCNSCTTSLALDVKRCSASLDADWSPEEFSGERRVAAELEVQRMLSKSLRNKTSLRMSKLDA